jgi:hypothetical protein
MNARAQKRSAADDSSNPLLQAGILQEVLDDVGPGHWLFISMVNKLWEDLYGKAEGRQVFKITNDHRVYGYTVHDRSTCVPLMTLFSSTFASSSRVRLARSSGLGCLKDKPLREYHAGRVADKSTLMTAH